MKATVCISDGRVMDEEILDDPEVLALLELIVKETAELDPLADDLTAAFDSAYPPPHCAKQLPAIHAKYTNVIARIDSLLAQSDRVLAMLEAPPLFSAAPSRAPSMAQLPIPSISVGSPHMIDYFLSRRIPRVGLPYPPLCGALPADGNNPLPIGSFVAAEINSMWSLCYIVGIEGTDFLLADVDPESYGTFKMAFDAVLPLPTSLPKSLTTWTEFESGSKVLALWPEESSWTTVFYPATVLKPPSETRSGYQLHFESGPKSTDVRADYVIRFPVNN
jgi:SAGA-associated factor 29